MADGMLPRTGITDEAAELLNDAAAEIFPGIANIEELDAKQQRFWIRLRENVVRDLGSDAELREVTRNCIERQAEAKAEDLRARREADLEDQEKRREVELEHEGARAEEDRKAAAEQKRAELADQEQRRLRRIADDAREGELHEQEMEDRAARRIVQWRRDHLLMAITVGSFVCMLGLIAVDALGGRMAIPGVGVTGLFTLAGGLRLSLEGQGLFGAGADPGPPR